ncbi:MAG: type III-A CRISPR-associated RAMP protein Csm5 [Smithella sp.]|nr:type III-A CRISPR-associated RAMP protein Csm5 [Smithella sp.]MDM7986613.1 type III-A CRISPR-associated RAMP protein Csm5 [Smithella sp.]HOU51744.1 type III-A CRISPR-associated RAMP protein Csm5 [Smithella sp.]HQG66318.1 type III-A CRISPR-associated RAMP protein Csm5 [Smithella sp.]HQI23454.1 type III-A CRISPR-associated RAMP protein Csm5 [Smithella sp.]
MNKTNTFYIKILSPVHIGCDDVYEPTGFVVNEQTETLSVFDPLDFFRSLDERTKVQYAAICSKGTVDSIFELYRFMRNRTYDGATVNLSKGFVKHYKDCLSKSSRDFQREMNQFSIARTSFSPNSQKPYLPGTAIKGALRTAYLNEVAKKERIALDPRDRKKSETLEKGLLHYKNLEDDPFRLLKVSDFHPVGSYRTKIVYAVNEKKRAVSRFKARGPYQILEIIEPGAVFVGTIEILTPQIREVIKSPLTQRNIFDSAALFYKKEKQREDMELKMAGMTPLMTDNAKDACLLRLGRHSGAESLTIDGYRDIKIMKQRGDKTFSDKATTFWLASDAASGYQKSSLIPFGWSEMAPLTAEMKTRFEQIQPKPEVSSGTVSISNASDSQTQERQPIMTSPPPVEEIWENASVSFNAGSGGVVTAQSTDQKTASIRGKEKAAAITDAILHKKLFEGKKTLPKAKVTVRKTGNAWEIVRIEPVG